jgi:hypothetical protein
MNVARPSSKGTPQEAAARMLERRKHHKLPDGTTIHDLITFGRAGSRVFLTGVRAQSFPCHPKRGADYGLRQGTSP